MAKSFENGNQKERKSKKEDSMISSLSSASFADAPYALGDSAHFQHLLGGVSFSLRFACLFRV